MKQRAQIPSLKSFVGAVLALLSWFCVLGGLASIGLGLAPFIWPHVWLADNLSFFQPLWMAMAVCGFGAGLLGLVAPHRFATIYRTAVTLMAAGLIVWAGTSGWWIYSLPKASIATPSSERKLRVVSINLERTYLRSPALTQFLGETLPDVLLLQESAWGLQQKMLGDDTGRNDIAGEPPYPPFRYSGTLGDLTVFSRYPLQDLSETRVSGETRNHWETSDREYVSFKVATGNGTIRLVTVHPTSPRTRSQFRDRQTYFEMLSGELEALAEAGDNTPLLVMGDWNTAPWSAFFADFLARHDLGTRFPGGFPQTTRFFYDYRLRWLFGANVDHIATSRGLSVSNVRLGPNIGSDHLPLIVDLLP